MVTVKVLAVAMVSRFSTNLELACMSMLILFYGRIFMFIVFCVTAIPFLYKQIVVSGSRIINLDPDPQHCIYYWLSLFEKDLCLIHVVDIFLSSPFFLHLEKFVPLF